MKTLTIGRKTVGGDHPTYFVADIAANHDGELDRAVELVRLAAEAGADAAKFQNFRAETIVSDAGFRALGGQLSHQASWDRSVFEVYAQASLPIEWTQTLRDACADAGIDYFTAPYDITVLDELRPYVCAWKVGSGDITWHDLIERLSRDGLPVLIATGASDMAEVQAAVAVARRFTDDLVVMQCNTNYANLPENFRHIDLRVLRTYAAAFPDVVLGLSDHTPGHATVLGAVTLGARVVEKHFTDDTSREGPDHGFSMDPPAWREMVDRTRELEAALGQEAKEVKPNESETVVLQRRALRAAAALTAGHTVTAEDLVALRPCPRDALPPHRAGELVGAVLRRDVARHEPLRPADVA